MLSHTFADAQVPSHVLSVCGDSEELSVAVEAGNISRLQEVSADGLWCRIVTGPGMLWCSHPALAQLCVSWVTLVCHRCFCTVRIQTLNFLTPRTHRCTQVRGAMRVRFSPRYPSAGAQGLTHHYRSCIPCLLDVAYCAPAAARDGRVDLMRFLLSKVCCVGVVNCDSVPTVLLALSLTHFGHLARRHASRCAGRVRQRCERQRRDAAAPGMWQRGSTGSCGVPPVTGRGHIETDGSRRRSIA